MPAHSYANTGSSLGPVEPANFEPVLSGLAEGQLVLPRCQHCGAWNWPPPASCRECGSVKLGYSVVDSVAGVLYSYTVVWHTRLSQFVDRVPYIVGIVEVAETGVRLAGEVESEDMSHLTIGAPAEPVFDTSDDGIPILRWVI